MRSPALWTTIATGQPRAVHGIFDFVTGSHYWPEQSEDRQLVTSDMRRSPSMWDVMTAANRRSLIANVWNADPEWSVTVHGDGGQKSAMQQRIGLDPWSVELHTGEDLPARRPWVDPVRTAHLYYAEVPSGWSRATVEAVDRFGSVFTESIDLG